MTRDLALVAYEARATWLLASGIIPTPWDELEPGTREMFRAEAKAVATAERERLLELLGERFKVVLLQDNGYPVDAVPWAALLDVLRTGMTAGGES